MAETHMPSYLGFHPNNTNETININAFSFVVATVIVFGFIILLVLVYLYTQHYWRSISTRRRAQLLFTAGEPPAADGGLDPEVLRSLPVTLYKPGDFNEGIECAVCLTDLAAGEEARVLEKCSHVFHLECIDMWFASRTTCPVCRCSVGGQVSGGEQPTARLLAGTEARVWGNENRVENSRGVLAISIPVRLADQGFSMSPLGSRRSRGEELKSPVAEGGSPTESKLGSFRRLLSRGRRSGGSSTSTPRVGDIEQGVVILGSAVEIGVLGVENSVFVKSPKNGNAWLSN